MVAGTNGKIINRIHEINDFKIRNNGEKRSEYDTFSMKSSHNAEHPANLMLNTNYIHPFAESVEMTVTTPTQSYSICNGYCINVEHPNNVMASQIECRFVIRYTPAEIHFRVFADPKMTTTK
ncbi:hypothetical protein DERF_010125 [Dermatophagoides farinae]|uniref:Uncharacterized protein n=1 Tax=Dermatophagoides farinae TaxID=6954 RepID=A0A922HXS0_DERFA|nr:hypothetical protein DERF_010125 [Dermatophagoides farinae]